ncbi:hypothetical protein AY601_5058 [Pedobacter cryoconitis]|uniref:Uncharacterized protein n=1 Tax=Pedobacter cryoconitis TaxID=188932 RepID=A0A127VL12_9SPHI|nr:hypothetical protein [Pedobacter cryoconitis]AMQ01871.1 hypothetical protein AY601_5058 [Pedobacter cryoconitis]
MIKTKIGVGKTDINIMANKHSIVIEPSIPVQPTNNKRMKDQDLKNSSIIDFIVSEQRKKKNELNAIVEENKTVIDNQTFFIENFDFGIVTKSEFLKFIGDDKPALREFQGFIQMMKENRKINHNLPYASKDGNEYYYLKIQGSNGDLNIKIKSLPWIDHLLHGYAFNKYNVNLDIEGLYTEATKLAE